jgi:hypothetical protein
LVVEGAVIAQQFVFVSHASRDKSLVRPIVEALIERNIKVWVDNPDKMGFSARDIERDFHRLHAGGRWRDEIHDALTTAAVVLVCWSRNSTGEVVRDEVAVGRAHRKLVACCIDDIDLKALPNAYADDQVADLRSVIEGAAPFDTRLDLLMRDIESKMTEVAGRGLGRRRLRDSFERYLINRTRQEDALGDAIEEVAGTGGAMPFVISGPENECLEEFIRRLEIHTSLQRLRSSAWHQIDVDWPVHVEPEAFAARYRRKLASALGLSSTASDSEVATALAARGRPVAVLSRIDAREWQTSERLRIRAWADWWRRLAEGNILFPAIPVLCVKMMPAQPGWRGCPRGRHPSAACSNEQIWRDAQRLGNAAKATSAGIFRLFRFFRRSTPAAGAITALPVLHPIERPDADRWVQRFEIGTPEHAAARKAIQELFTSRRSDRYGVPLQQFADAMGPVYGSQ